MLTDASAKLDSGYLFIGKGVQGNPEIGDIRISYTALASPTTVTVFGQQSGQGLVPYLYDKSSTFFRALTGDRNSAISQLQTEHTLITWLLRGAGFLMLWLGLTLVLNPLATIAGVLPLLKQITGFLTGIVTFIVALVLWGVATLISVVLHNIWLVLAAAVIIVGIVLFLLRRRQAM